MTVVERLVVRHHATQTGDSCEIQRVDARGAKAAPAVALEDPLTLGLEGTAEPLGRELAWYLESYLDYPFGPNEARAARVQAALQAWGARTFDALFGHGQARDFYRDATRAGHTALQLSIVSDDPRVLSWPWEALRDPAVGDLAQHCRIERQLDTVPEPLPLPEGLDRERVRILLVTARPYEGDIAYRSISRPLVELIQRAGLPASVTLLRPPTFAQLRRELQEHPGGYHLVHFDGHGGFGQVAAGSRDRFRGPQGQLVFETEDGGEAPITAATLSQLLREHRIPIVVLNACQSAMITAQAEDAFASVATALLRAGVRSVVAMGYSLYVSGAKKFLPAFYEALFRTGSVAEATRAGRQAMLAQPQRRGEIELQDWLVPVLYQQDPLALDFAAQPRAAAAPAAPNAIPDAARLEARQAPHGVIGRDSAVLALERASRRAPAAVLLHGLGGIGKTTLARGYIQWLADTQGLPERMVWQSLAEVRSFDYVRNRLVEALFGTDAMAWPDTQKWPTLERALREHAVLVVWDNFESASGAADAGGGADAMPAEDRQALKQWLEALRGGQTKVLITSRSDEAWIGTEACYRVALSGLQGQERQALAGAILADVGKRLDARDAGTAALIDSLHGHPLMMRAILPKLATTSAATLREALERWVPQADSTDPVEQRLYATLRYIEEGLPAALRPLLLPIGLHDRFVDADYLAAMAADAQQPFTVADTHRALELLAVAGLVQGHGQNVYELHPALERYARTRGPALVPRPDDALAWQRANVTFMASLAAHYTPKALHEQRPVFHYFGGSFERALGQAQLEGDLDASGALLQALARYALNRRILPLAAQRLEALAITIEQQGREDRLAALYHQLGIVADERRDLAAAEAWYRKSLAIKERQGDEHGAAISYHQLGVVAEERRDLAAAEAWYRKSLAIKEKRGNELGAASTYHQLGSVAQERRDFAAAEDWYRKSLAITERHGNEHRAATTYHQLGMVAQERRDLAGAEAWYRQALAIDERQGNEHHAANTYHQLGIVAEERRDFAAAEAWYRKSLAVDERQGNEHGAAMSYHQLGIVAQERRDFAAAEAWYRKSLAIDERQGNEHGAASTYHQLGMVAEERGDAATAEDAYGKALSVFERLDDAYNCQIVERALQRVKRGTS
jgi:tetratricopeptide (TPR) repeat protein